MIVITVNYREVKLHKLENVTITNHANGESPRRQPIKQRTSKDRTSPDGLQKTGLHLMDFKRRNATYPVDS